MFANIVLADEINRASPKTQSALLEAMEEDQVTVDGVTYPLGAPFMVIATQNPIELEGTYPLPEAQLDRFLMRIEMGYPDRAAEVAILETQSSHLSVEELSPVATAEQITALVDFGRFGARRRSASELHRRARERDASSSRPRVGCEPPRCTRVASGSTRARGHARP